MGIRKVNGDGTNKPLPLRREVSRKVLETSDLTNLAAFGCIRRSWDPKHSSPLKDKVTQGKGNPSAVARSDKMRSCITNRSFIAMVAHRLNHRKM